MNRRPPTDHPLAQLVQKITSCRRCPLWEMAKNPVPGEGNSQPELVFVGEAPGYHEDQQGRPFVGAAGKLLEQSLADIEMNREEVYICNILKHRPPGNRDPLPEEIHACRPWLDRQLELLDPKLVVTLGRFSMAYFIPTAKISQIHGQVYQAESRLILPLYHPAAALRSAAVMEDFRSDFRKIPQALKDGQGVVVEKKSSVGTETKPLNAGEEQLVLI